MDTGKQDETTSDAKQPAATEDPPVQHKLYAVLASLEQAVKLKETRLSRAMRLSASIRKELTGSLLHTFISTALAADVETKPFLLAHAQQVPGSLSSLMLMVLWVHVCVCNEWMEFIFSAPVSHRIWQGRMSLWT